MNRFGLWHHDLWGRPGAKGVPGAMSIQPVPPAGPIDPARTQELLFTPGPRLGWTFRDRGDLVAVYPEPPPDPQAYRQHAAAHRAAAERSWATTRRWAGKPSIAIALILVLLAACAKTVDGSVNISATIGAVLVLAGPGLVWTLWRWAQLQQARTTAPDQAYQQALAAWRDRADAHRQGELARVEHVPEWGSAQPATPRTDVFGGTLAGWQALLTVHGASVLAAQPLLLVDLTGQQAGAMLDATVREMRIPAAAYTLPGDLGKCGLLASLDAGQFAAAVTEALHAGTPGGARADRAVDVAVLTALAGAIEGGGVSPERLAAAVRVAFGSPVPSRVLSATEQQGISGTLFPPGYRQQITANLVRLDAVLSDLARYSATGPWTKPAPSAYCTFLAVQPGARSAASEVLTALVVQWLTVQVTHSPQDPPAVIVAGADEITSPHLERLAEACARRGVPLTFLFRHLREEARGLLGGGTAAFMRLGNHTEAEEAAAYLGRQHKFVVSTFTATKGGSQTYTTTESQGYGSSESRSVTRNRGWNEQHLGARSASGGHSRTFGTTGSRNWSTGSSQADGTTWTDATGTQRVYEYQVEPAVLQNLPDCALLLADRSAGNLQVRTVECDPDILTLPRASLTPLAPHSPSWQPGGGLPYPPAPAEMPAPAEPPPRRPPSDAPWWERKDH
jgi:hypothetical protein